MFDSGKLMDLVDMKRIAGSRPIRPIRNATRGIRASRRVRRPAVRARNAIFDRLAEIVVEDVVIDVDEFGGQFTVDSRSALFRRVIETGSYETELTKVLLEHLDPDRDVVDVGANIGFHSVLFSSVTSQRVLAIEPTAAAAARLRSNLERNGCANAIVWQGAASDHSGTVDISVIKGREEFSSIGTIVHVAALEGVQAPERAPCEPLDALVERHGLSPGLIKIDTEGSEHLVLGGANHVLSVVRPVIVSELSEPLLATMGSSAEEVIQLIQSYDYEVTDPLRAGEAAGSREYGDILCLPR